MPSFKPPMRTSLIVYDPDIFNCQRQVRHGRISLEFTAATPL